MVGGQGPLGTRTTEARVREFSDEALELVAERFKLLADTTRLRILNALRAGERTVGDLVSATEAGQANVSKHLGLLLRAGLVDRRKEGLNAYYRIADPRVFELCELVCDGIEAELDTRRSQVRGGAGV
jgi:DNA-binding transcriptional ArsR family regulator